MSHNGSHIAAPTLAIAYHSGFGHTAVLADAVAAGAGEVGADLSVIAVDRMTEADWDILDGADGIVFGSATYMGNVSAGFQAFAEQTGRRCLNGSWRDKVAAGFTNSGAKSGDKVQTLVSLAVFAAQHSDSGWARVRRPTLMPIRTRCTRPMCRRAAILGAGSRW